MFMFFISVEGDDPVSMAIPGMVKLKWMDYLNAAWAEEDCEIIASHNGATSLYERLLTNVEVVPVPQQVKLV